MKLGISSGPHRLIKVDEGFRRLMIEQASTTRRKYRKVSYFPHCPALFPMVYEG